MDKDIIVKLILQAMAFNQGTAEGKRGLESLKQEVKATDAAAKDFQATLNVFKAVLAALGLGKVVSELEQLGLSAIKASENVNQLKGSIAAIVAANETIKDSNGRLVEGVQKIQIVQNQVSGLFKQIQQDALKTSDTTQGLIEKFQLALSPGLAAGMNLDQVRKLTTALSVSMSALMIDTRQARTEIRELLTGEGLESSDLARGLSLREQDIKAAIKQGNLYDLLMRKMKDFLAAGELQSRTLTGVTSSLDDLRGKLLQTAGDRAVDTLTQAFGDLLDSMQDADGALTPLGRDMQTFAHDAGIALDDVIKNMVKVMNEAIRMGRIVANAMQGAQIQAKQAEAEANVNAGLAGGVNRGQAGPSALDPKGLFAGKSVQDVRNLLPGLRDQARTAAADHSGIGGTATNARVNDLLQMEIVGKRIVEQADKDVREGRMRAYNDIVNPEVVSANQAAAKAAGASRVTTTLNKPSAPVDKAAAAKAHQLAVQADQDALQTFLQNLTEAMHASDLQEKKEAITSDGSAVPNDDRKIALLQAARQALPATKTAEGARARRKELHQLDLKLKDEVIQKDVDVAKGVQLRTDKQNALNAAIEKGQAANSEANQARELEHIKATNKLATDALQDRYQRGELSAMAFYGKLADLRSADVMAEFAAQRSKLQGERTTLQAEYQRETGKKGKDFNSARVADLKGQITGVDAALAGLPGQQADAQASIAAEKARGIAEATRAGLSAAVDAVFSGSMSPVLSSMETSAKQGLVNALASSQVGQAIASAFGSLGSGGGLVAAAGLLGINAIQGVMAESKAGDDIGLGMEADYYGTLPSSRQADQLAIQNAAKSRKKKRDDNSFWTRETPAEQARLDGLESGIVDGQQRQSEDKQASADLSRWSKARAAGRMNLQDEIDSLHGLLAVFSGTQEAYQDLVDHMTQLQAEKATEAVDNRKKAEAAGAAAIETTWRESIARVDEIQRQAVEAQVDRLQKLKKANEDAAKARETASQRGVIGGDLSQAQENLKNLEAKAKGKQTEIDAMLGLNRDDQGRLGQLQGYAGGKYSVIANDETGIRALGGKKFLTTSVNQSTLAGDLDSLTKLAGNNVQVIDQRTGRTVSLDELRRASLDAQSVPGILASREKDISGAQGDLQDIRNQIGIAQAQVNRSTGDTLKASGLDREIQRASAYGNQGLTRQLKYDEVGDYIQQKRDELYQSGVLTSATPDGEKNAVLGKLDQLRDVMKQQVDKEYTEANPLPVHVVNPAALFALPSSDYFRARGASVNLAAGAVVVNGSGLDPDQLRGAIVGAASDLARGVTRETTYNEARVTAG